MNMNVLNTVIPSWTVMGGAMSMMAGLFMLKNEMVKPWIAGAGEGSEADVPFSEGETAVSFLKSPLLAKATSLVMTGLDLYLDLYLDMYYWGEKQAAAWCAKYPALKWTVDRLRYHGVHLWRMWNQFPTEPDADTWTCEIELEGMANGDKRVDFVYRELYHKGMCGHLLNVSAGSENDADRFHLWMYKSGGIYHMRAANQHIDFITTPVPSKVRFLSVEYHHPKMDHPVPLEIPAEMYYTGNCLFTPAFVARMLRYTVGDPRKYVFDLGYELHIMDANLRYFTLPSFQWIELDKTMYLTRGSPFSAMCVGVWPSLENDAPAPDPVQRPTWWARWSRLTWIWKRE
jgi:hypothetical protein